MERQKEVVGFDVQPRVAQLVRWKLERIILEDAYTSYETDTCRYDMKEKIRYSSTKVRLYVYTWN